MAAGAVVDARAKAWQIYRDFLLPGATMEVSSTCSDRKDIAHALASPTADMLNNVKQSALAMLRADFQKFKCQPTYDQLGVIMKDKFKELHAAKRSKAKRGGFFGICFFGKSGVGASG